MENIFNTPKQKKTPLEKIQFFTQGKHKSMWDLEEVLTELVTNPEVNLFLREVDFMYLEQELGMIENGYDLHQITDIIIERDNIPELDVITWAVKHDLNTEKMFPVEPSRYTNYLCNLDKKTAINLARKFKSSSTSCVILAREDISIEESLKLLHEIHPTGHYENGDYSGSAVVSTIWTEKKVHPTKIMDWIMCNIQNPGIRNFIITELMINYICQYSE